MEDIAASGLTDIEDRRLPEDRGEGRSAHILSPHLIADSQWHLVLRPQNPQSAIAGERRRIDPLQNAWARVDSFA